MTLTSAIDSILSYWRATNVRVSPPASEENLLEVQRRWGGPWPADLVALYRAADGMLDEGGDDVMFTFWPLRRVSDALAEVDDSSRWTSVCGVPIGDFLIDSHRYLVVLDGPKAGTVVLSLGSGIDQPAASTLEAFLTILLHDPGSLSMFDRPGAKVPARHSK